jgi:electron transport complex protein RnfC
MKLFRISGGVHLTYRKELTSDSAIVPLPMPQMLYLPLQQHVGAPSEPVVKPGDLVTKGQLLAAAHGSVSAPVHAPTSGRIVEITGHVAPHPSGLSQATIVLEADGEDRWGELPEGLADPFTATPQDIGRRVAAAGIVGLGGAVFPAAVKLNLRAGHKLDMLLLNGAECEPYLTCDDRVMREYADEVIDGARIMAHTLGITRIVVAIETNKPQALEAITAAAAPFDTISAVGVPARYPMGSAHHLVKTVTGRETPAHGRTASVGVLVHNVGTARAIHHAIRFGRPLVSRVVTVSGDAIAEGRNIDVPLGTRVSELIAFCGGVAREARRVISGGPMMGHPIPSLDMPVVKGTCGILALTAQETNEQAPGPCIRCGACVTACPSGLVPLEMAAWIRKDDLEKARQSGVEDCISCGSCSYICPSHIPLMQYFQYANGRLSVMDRDARKQETIKMMAEARRVRVERLARAKREAMAARAQKAQATAPAAAPATSA